jgi:hypothetical protein
MMVMMRTVGTMHMTVLDFFLALLLLFHRRLLTKKESWNRTLPCYVKGGKSEILSSKPRLGWAPEAGQVTLAFSSLEIGKDGEHVF